MAIRAATGRLTVAALALASAVAAAGCGGTGGRDVSIPSGEPETTLRAAAPSRTAGGGCAPGVHSLTPKGERVALLHVTAGGRGGRKALLLALHGAGSGGARGGLYAFRGAWEEPGLALVAPSAAGTTWTLGRMDLDFVDLALRRAFARCRVDPRRVAVGGFSAGAGLALWLGLTNGDLFHAVISLSGGSGLPRVRVGKPRIYVAHGIRDDVIPIQYGGDALVPELRAEGYDVTYRRFRDGHRALPEISRSSVRWFLRG